jgi:prepilin-type N-terminal cleavage/methylation domain-containing protein
MQKKNGFSLLELLIVTGIVALLAAISVPNYMRMRSFSSFNDEVNLIFDQFLEVRTNALTGKMCNNSPSLKWIFTLDQNSSQILCQNSAEEIATADYDVIWRNTQQIELDDGVAYYARVEFLPDTTQATIPVESVQYTDLKILLEHSSGRQRTICFNRIAGIPEISSGNIDCTP